MTIKPLKSYKAPAYPTLQESRQDARLLERVPQRWGKNTSLASLLGTGILIQLAGTGRADEAATEAADAKIVLPAGQDEKDAAANAVRAIPVTRVAPMLAEALANDGRGSFGCIAISAPVFLSENEAMDLIEAELAKAGLKVKDMVAVDGLKVPDRDAEFDFEKTEDDDEKDWRKFKMKKLKKGSYTFDLGTEDKSVVVKFLRTKDYENWQDKGGVWSSVSVYDLTKLATQMGEAFKARAEGEPVVIGLFFDPLHKVEWRGEKSRDDAKAESLEKLRGQVLHFVNYLKEEGVVE